MKRIVARGIIFIGDEIGLMYRDKYGDIYYTLPGGGVDEDELLTDGVIREVYEEFGINVKPIKLCYIDSDEKKITHYFLCEYLSGEFGSGEGEEFKDDRRGGLYQPQLIKISDLKNIRLVPDELKEVLIKDIENYGKELRNNILVLNKK